jgi:acyl carrier protein
MQQPLSEDVLRQIMARITRRPATDIRPESRLRADLGLDSMLSLELLVTLEEDYALVIPQEDVHGFERYGDLIAYVRKRLDANKAP